MHNTTPHHIHRGTNQIRKWLVCEITVSERFWLGPLLLRIQAGKAEFITTASKIHAKARERVAVIIFPPSRTSLCALTLQFTLRDSHGKKKARYKQCEVR
jgi:hypothetical protein